MSPLLKFWIASTVLLFLLAIWPFTRHGEGDTALSESEFVQAAQLVDRFCLAQTPTGGRASNPKAWEEALDADIRIRESAGEAAADAGFPRDQAKRITSLQPGEGILHTDSRQVHYLMKSGQGREWFVVLTKKNSSGIVTNPQSSGLTPSPIALAIAFALVGGGLMTLLAKVAFNRPPATV